jgi:hypothetical protein
MPQALSSSVRERRSPYFFGMSLVLLAIVLVGFAPSLYLRSLSELQALPLRLHIHGAVLTSWYVWLVVQASAIRGGATALHRRLGVIGAGIGAACVVAGPLATLGAVRSLRALGLDWDTDLRAYPALGIEGIPMELYAKQLVFTNLTSVLIFAVLLFMAIRRRLDVVAHKRLVLLASIVIVPPALARIARWPGLGGEDGVVIPLSFFALLASVAVHDYLTTRRIHRVTWVSIVGTGVVLAGSAVLAATPLGSAVVRALA